MSRGVSARAMLWISSWDMALADRVVGEDVGEAGFADDGSERLVEVRPLGGGNGLATLGGCAVVAASMEVNPELPALGDSDRSVLADAFHGDGLRSLSECHVSLGGVQLVLEASETPDSGLEPCHEFTGSGVPSVAAGVGVGVPCAEMLRGEDEDGVVIDPGVVLARLAHTVAVVAASCEYAGGGKVLGLVAGVLPCAKSGDFHLLAGGFGLGGRFHSGWKSSCSLLIL